MANKTTNAFLGFIAGVATGAALGVLYAPDKGSKTRKNIKKQSDKISGDVRDAVNEKVDGLKDYVNQSLGDVKDRFSKIEKEVKEKAEQTRKNAKTS
ncbi:MAG: YtxH domain-containing protein [Bacteroidota bacterium]|nr:YtxH domain-containing protein [Bacteroidota bacterium]